LKSQLYLFTELHHDLISLCYSGDDVIMYSYLLTPNSGGSRNLERGVQSLAAHPKIFGLPHPLLVTLLHS